MKLCLVSKLTTAKGGKGSGWFAPPQGTHTGEKHRQSGSGMASKQPSSSKRAKQDAAIQEIWSIAGVARPGSGVEKRLSKRQADDVFDALSNSKLRRSTGEMVKGPGGIGSVLPRVWLFKHPDTNVTARLEARHSRYGNILNVGDTSPSSDYLVVAVSKE